MPGEGDFPLSQQIEILASLQSEEIGVTVSPGRMISPRKTLTALAGFAHYKEDAVPAAALVTVAVPAAKNNKIIKASLAGGILCAVLQEMLFASLKYVVQHNRLRPVGTN